jgi:hypothetical protein
VIDPYLSAQSYQAINLAGDTSFAPTAKPVRGIIVGVAGDIKVDAYAPDGTTTTGLVLPAITVGEHAFGRILKIYSTANGTTASSLVVLF